MWFIPMSEKKRFDYLFEAVTSQDPYLIKNNSFVITELQEGYAEQVISRTQYDTLIRSLESNVQKMSEAKNL
ncbi:MAG: hypothetical protein V4596_13650 [Bdellovibrionota bacterium]